jgi:hypothetical protein
MKGIKVLICGDRYWKSYPSILKILKRLINAYGKNIIVI